MSLRSWIKKWLLDRGMILSRPPGQFLMGPYKLAAARDRGLDIKCIIDCGAAKGAWSTEIRAIWPAAQILCIEPRDNTQQELQRMRSQLGNIEIAQVLLGSEEGNADLYINGDASSVIKDFAIRTSTAKRMPVTTLDRLVAGTPFEKPDLIKLDLQGAELSALKGAIECLKHVAAIQVEVSFLEFSSGTPLIADIFAFLYERDFVAYDILGLWHRPLDGALAQGDILFVRTGSPLRADRRYWAEDTDRQVNSASECVGGSRK